MTKDEEDEVMKKVIDLEKLRPNLSDVNSLNKEIVTLKKKQTIIKSRIREIKESLTSINTEIDECDNVINEFRDATDVDTMGDKEEIRKVRDELDKITESTKHKRKEKSKILEDFKEQKRVMDFWKDVKRNID